MEPTAMRKPELTMRPTTNAAKPTIAIVSEPLLGYASRVLVARLGFSYLLHYLFEGQALHQGWLGSLDLGRSQRHRTSHFGHCPGLGQLSEGSHWGRTGCRKGRSYGGYYCRCSSLGSTGGDATTVRVAPK
jgi:hypothetical protein